MLAFPASEHARPGITNTEYQTNSGQPLSVKKAVSCPECGGTTRFNPARKMIVCESCGLSFTRDEFDKMRDKLKSDIAMYDDTQRQRVTEDQKKSRNKEYQDWWSSEHGTEE